MISNSYMRALAVSRDDGLQLDAMLRSAKRLVRAGIVDKSTAANELRALGACEPEITEALAS